MRLASMLLVAACLALFAHADGKPRRAKPAGPAPAAAAPAPLDRQTERKTPARSVPIGHELEIYRFGGTYAVMPGTTVHACEATCGEDSACKAWSFVDAYGSAEARCELKRSAGRAEENLLSTSGLSPALKAKYLGTPQRPDPVDRSQLFSDGGDTARANDIQLMASVPVLTYRPVEPPIAATQSTAGIQLPMTQPSISFTPVASAEAAPALRYTRAAPEATGTQEPGAARTYYPNRGQGEGGAETGSGAYYPPRSATTSPNN